METNAHHVPSSGPWGNDAGNSLEFHFESWSIFSRKEKKINEEHFKLESWEKSIYTREKKSNLDRKYIVNIYTAYMREILSEMADQAFTNVKRQNEL